MEKQIGGAYILFSSSSFTDQQTKSHKFFKLYIPIQEGVHGFELYGYIITGFTDDHDHYISANNIMMNKGNMNDETETTAEEFKNFDLGSVFLLVCKEIKSRELAKVISALINSFFSTDSPKLNIVGKRRTIKGLFKQ